MGVEAVPGGNAPPSKQGGGAPPGVGLPTPPWGRGPTPGQKSRKRELRSNLAGALQRALQVERNTPKIRCQ
jgi:hypothetical protein